MIKIDVEKMHNTARTCEFGIVSSGTGSQDTPILWHGFCSVIACRRREVSKSTNFGKRLQSGTVLLLELKPDDVTMENVEITRTKLMEALAFCQRCPYYERQP